MTERRIGPRLQEHLDEACELLAHYMPERIRVPRWASSEHEAKGKGRWANPRAQGERDIEIRRLRAEGASYGKLALRFGLTRAGVQAIIRAGRPLVESEAA